MAGPLVIPGLAEKAGEGLSKAVKTDLFVIKKTFYKERKIKVPASNKRGWKYEKVLEPIEVEFHGSPQNLGIGAVALALAAGVGWFVWNGLDIHSGIGNTTLIPGFKESGWADKYRARQLAKGDKKGMDTRTKTGCEAAGGIWDPVTNHCFLP